MPDGNMSSLFFELFDSLPLMLASSLTSPELLSDPPPDGVSDLEPAGETWDVDGGIEASVVTELDAC